MKILLLEDNVLVRQQFRELLIPSGYDVIDASDVWDARYQWQAAEAAQQLPQGIILDLQVGLEGLAEEHVEATCGGDLTGWVWLSTDVLPNYPEMRSRTFIYSGFVSELRSHVRADELDGLHLVRKPLHPKEILEWLKHIAQLPPLAPRRRY